MNKSMLVGAVGLALAGVAVASNDATSYVSSIRTDASTFVRMRDSVLGEAGSQRRADVLAQLSDEIAAGNIDPRTVVFALTEDLISGSSGGANLFGAPEGGLGANALCYDDFSTYNLTNFTNPPTSLISLAGQSNPCGQVIATAGNARIGAATDAIMTNVPMGNPGGIAPSSASPHGGEPYMVLARRTGLSPRVTANSLAMNYLHDLIVPLVDPEEGHARIATSWYLLDAETNNWWSPVSFTEGFIWDRVFFGGKHLGGVLGFAENANNVLDNFVSLGTLPGNFQIGQFYAPQHHQNFPFPVNKWFSMMAVMTQNESGGIGQGLFIKTPDTVAANFMDPRMASGEIVPTDKDPLGWVNTFPGIPDDPGTMGIIEGIGYAVTQFGELAPINGAFGLTPIFAALSVSGTQFGYGNDPTAALDPNYLANDTFADGYVAKGTEFVQPCPLPDFILPYEETFELYFVGQPVRLQTDLLIDNISSNSVISGTQNTTPNGMQSMAQQAVNNDNLYREEFGTNLPNFPEKVYAKLGDDGMPFTQDANEGSMVLEARIRLNPSVLTGRAVRIFDGAEFGQYAATVLLGGTDPTSGFAAADGRIWVRQPNIGPDGVWGVAPGFDENLDSDDNLLQGSYIPETEWAFPPATAPFNTTFINVRAGASGNNMGQTVSPGTFHTLRVEIQPNPDQDPNNLFDEGVMRVIWDGVELFPDGDSTRRWIAGSVSATDVTFWSSNNTNGQAETIHVDDIKFSGPLLERASGPAFSLPYVDGFETYALNISIDGQGDAPYVSLASLPDEQGFDFNHKLTVLNTNSNVPVNGTMVCRYMVTELCLDVNGELEVGSIVALNHDALPLPYNTFLPTNLDCPGIAGAATRFTTRPGHNMPRIEDGSWTLLSQTPVAFDSGSGDLTGYSYDYTTIGRWTVGGSDQGVLVVADPTTEGVNAVLHAEVLGSFDGSQSNHPMGGLLGSFLPVAQTASGAFPSPNVDVVLEWDTYIESLDLDGNPDNSLPPRSRMEVPIIGAGSNFGRITNIMFGGPNVNNHSALIANGVDTLPLDVISYAVSSGLDDPRIMYVETDVSLVSGGGGISGSLLNTWFRSRFTIHSNGSWSYEIDEDRDGPADYVLVATQANAVDEGLIGIDGAVVDTDNTDSFNVNIGQDLGSGGDPVVPPTRVRVIQGPSGSNWDAVGPSNAHPTDDYCFYSVNTEEFKDVANAAKIAEFNDDGTAQDVAPADGMIDIRDLGSSNDVIAVLNRAVNGSNMVFGPKIFAECPINNRTINQFELYDAAGTAVRYLGRWALMGQVGQAGVNNPNPAGGITRPGGPAGTPPLAYNNHLAEPPGYPATPAAREIILAKFGSDDMDATNGVDPFDGVYPRSRWYFDNVSLSETGGGTPCADLAGDPDVVNGADLAQLLAVWYPNTGGNPPVFGNPADLNADGYVNGADLATLLANWGPCP